MSVAQTPRRFGKGTANPSTARQQRRLITCLLQNDFLAGRK